MSKTMVYLTEYITGAHERRSFVAEGPVGRCRFTIYGELDENASLCSFGGSAWPGSFPELFWSPGATAQCPVNVRVTEPGVQVLRDAEHRPARELHPSITPPDWCPECLGFRAHGVVDPVRCEACQGSGIRRVTDAIRDHLRRWVAGYTPKGTDAEALVRFLDENDDAGTNWPKLYERFSR